MFDYVPPIFGHHEPVLIYLQSNETDAMKYSNLEKPTVAEWWSRDLWNLNHHRDHNIQKTNSISQMNPVQTLTTHSFMHINIILTTRPTISKCSLPDPHLTVILPALQRQYNT